MDSQMAKLLMIYGVAPDKTLIERYEADKTLIESLASIGSVIGDTYKEEIQFLEDVKNFKVPVRDLGTFQIHCWEKKSFITCARKRKSHKLLE